jgi:sarcosine oxidase, subunit beta
MSRETADAVVIGAGVIGSSIALELARCGRRVVVVDKGPGPGTGSTSASSACVRFHYSTWEGVVTAWESKHRWEHWADHLGAVDPAGLSRYVRTGVLVLDFPDFDSHRVLELYRKVGIPVERLSAAEITDRFGLDAGRHYPPKALGDAAFWDDAAGDLDGFWTPDGGFVDDPQLAAHNLLYAAQVSGAQAGFNTAVAEIRRSGDSVHGVQLSDGRFIAAPVVVNAAGPHSGRINDIAGVTDEFLIRTRPLRQEVHHVPAPAGFQLDGNTPMVGDGDLGTYFRPQPGGSILVGGQEPACDELTWLDDPDVFDPGPSVPVYEAQVTRLARRLPDVAVPPRPKGVVGVYDVSDDWIPIYDRTSLGGYYVAIGTSGNQFKNAPVVGEMLRTVIEACEAGRDHDEDPVTWTAPMTDLEVNLGHYSRRRRINEDSSFSVLG